MWIVLSVAINSQSGFEWVCLLWGVPVVCVEVALSITAFNSHQPQVWDIPVVPVGRINMKELITSVVSNYFSPTHCLLLLVFLMWILQCVHLCHSFGYWCCKNYKYHVGQTDMFFFVNAKIVNLTVIHPVMAHCILFQTKPSTPVSHWTRGNHTLCCTAL